MLRVFLKPVAIFPPKWIKKNPDFLGHDFSDFFEILEAQYTFGGPAERLKDDHF